MHSRDHLFWFPSARVQAIVSPCPSPPFSLSSFQPLSSHPGSSTGGPATTQHICDNLKDQKEKEAANCDLPPVPQVPTFVTSAPVYQAEEETQDNNDSIALPSINLTPPDLPTPPPPPPAPVGNLTPPLLLRRVEAVDEQFGKQIPPSFPTNQGLCCSSSPHPS